MIKDYRGLFESQWLLSCCGSRRRLYFKILTPHPYTSMDSHQRSSWNIHDSRVFSLKSPVTLWVYETLPQGLVSKNPADTQLSAKYRYFFDGQTLIPPGKSYYAWGEEEKDLSRTLTTWHGFYNSTSKFFTDIIAFSIFKTWVKNKFQQGLMSKLEKLL